MKNILNNIDSEKQKLSEHDLIQWMSTAENPLSFVQAMTFFVLGFRDVLSYLKRPNPEDIWDHSINVHCEEDANHWLWFIEDLKKIGVKETIWGNDFSELLKATWSENGYASRDMIYTLIHFAKVNKDPFIHLTLIESLEAAFAVFIDALLPQIKKRGWQNELRYFGSRHHEEEANHALGAWIGEPLVDKNLKDIILNEYQERTADLMVKKIFLNFHNTFNSWFAQKNSFQGSFRPITHVDLQTKAKPFYQTEQ